MEGKKKLPSTTQYLIDLPQLFEIMQKLTFPLRNCFENENENKIEVAKREDLA